MKKYALLGEKLTYSYSQLIHTYLLKHYHIDATYELKEVKQLTRQLLEKYDGVNITIPYKEDVIDLLDENKSPIAACNTVMCHQKRCIGYNTDIIGFDLLVQKLNIASIQSVVILGSGATSKMVQDYFKTCRIIVVSRQSTQYNYANLATLSADLLVNTTPIGMASFESPIPATDIGKYKGIIDLNYNPINSKLAHLSKTQQVPFINGLYMLIKQAAVAFELWHDVSVTDELIDQIYTYICFTTHDKIAVIGMPFSGKTTLITKYSGLDLDAEIIKRSQQTIATLFASDQFRVWETTVLEQVVNEQQPLLALGGGAILKADNMVLLKDYLVVFLDTPLVTLKQRFDMNSRPLLKSVEALEQLYDTRRCLYEQYANVTVSYDEVEGFLDANYGH